MPLKLAVYGLGHLGLPLAVVLKRAGYDVIGVDPHPEMMTIEPTIKKSELADLQGSTSPQPSDISFIVVPTPSTENGDFDSKYVAQALGGIAAVNEGHPHTAVLVSTVSPGTCTILRAIAGADHVTLVYNPTFIALGDVISGLVRPDLLMIGCPDREAQAQIAGIWSQVFHTQQHRYDNPTYYHFADRYEEVELLKLSVNAYLGTKISLANSLGQLFRAYGIDPAKVQVMEKDPRIGKGYLLPGSPITGPCLPRDNKALHYAAEQVCVDLPLSVATEEIQSTFYFDLVAEIVESNPTSVGILGMSYKPGVDVTTDSVGSFLKGLLVSQYTVKCWDPHPKLETDDFEDVLACDVVVVTQRDLMPKSGTCKRVVSLW